MPKKFNRKEFIEKSKKNNHFSLRRHAERSSAIPAIVIGGIYIVVTVIFLTSDSTSWKWLGEVFPYLLFSSIAIPINIVASICCVEDLLFFKKESRKEDKLAKLLP